MKQVLSYEVFLSIKWALKLLKIGNCSSRRAMKSNRKATPKIGIQIATMYAKKHHSLVGSLSICCLTFKVQCLAWLLLTIILNRDLAIAPCDAGWISHSSVLEQIAILMGRKLIFIISVQLLLRHAYPILPTEILRKVELTI